MGKKKINIILILVVLGLWGTVGFKTLHRYFGDTIIVANTEVRQENVSLKKIDKDTFELKKMNHDPFLNASLQTEVVPAAKHITNYVAVKKTAVPAAKKMNLNLSWPTLTYYGYFGSKEGNQQLILLKIDSKLCKLKINTPFNGLIVKKKYKDSIEVCFNSESKIVRLKT